MRKNTPPVYVQHDEVKEPTLKRVVRSWAGVSAIYSPVCHGIDPTALPCPFFRGLDLLDWLLNEGTALRDRLFLRAHVLEAGADFTNEDFSIVDLLYIAEQNAELSSLINGESSEEYVGLREWKWKTELENKDTEIRELQSQHKVAQECRGRHMQRGNGQGLCRGVRGSTDKRQ